ncbi:FeoA family protein [Thermosediminibacter oceani]|uniref:FeoA family protein n=1 Tax=Thermosediminibacter oceani (strain ATCC BAA-1034 / DSM 16646 / JW/IW-1228P) TaxID=555079 RepID=D9S034_THEOJ|nr:FeoA family protein [Thermosediminibacter oceani]ADL06962.1 FeoA family protein [Thermosediminibacter oceani DSM 16646]
MAGERNLTQLKIGEQAVIAKINAPNGGILKKLMALGVLPGARVSLVQKFPSYVIKVGNTQIAADETIAKSIIVIKN